MSPLGRCISLTSPANHRRTLFFLSCAASTLTFLFTAMASQLPLFDSSPHIPLLPPSPGFSLHHMLASSVLRWDAFHFAHLAKDGYVYEHEWAFFPGTPFVMRSIGRLIRLFVHSSVGLDWDDVLLGGLLASTLSALSVLTLYDLTLLQLGSPNIALLASLLSLLPSSPVTLRVAGYSEPLFTTLSYQGMHFCARRRWFPAALCFALASTFRSNGIFLSGFIIWGLVVEPLLDHHQVRIGAASHAVALSTLTVLPFVYHQYSAYILFCTDPANSAPWCRSFPPSIYTYVQSKYWNVGFLRYWTAQQLPNFLLGAPPLMLLFMYTTHYIHKALMPRLRPSISSYLINSDPKANPASKDIQKQLSSPFLHHSLAPHVVHALFISLLLTFASHTQIVLRLAASMPLTYWAAAWLLVEHVALGRYWIAWSIIWGSISCILWAAFLPPA